MNKEQRVEKFASRLALELIRVAETDPDFAEAVLNTTVRKLSGAGYHVTANAVIRWRNLLAELNKVETKPEVDI